MPMRPLRILPLFLLLPACGRGDAAGETGPPDEQPAETAPTPGRVALSPTAIAAAGIRVQAVAAAELPSASGALEIPGQVEFDSSRIAVVSPRASGRLERMTAVPGERIGSAAPVAYLSSPDYLAAQSDLVQAARRARLLEGTADAEGAGALLGAARQRLLLLGATEAEIRRLLEGAEPSLLLPVRAPMAGTILEALAQPGIAVEPGTPIFRIADLGVVHVVAQVPEGALAQVRPGMRAEISVPAYPARRFRGEVARILEQLDPETRTARVLVRVPNPERALKAGMFGTVRIEGARAVESSAARVLVVPAQAVLTDGEQRFVFVQVAPGTFEKRVVTVAAPEPGAAPSDRLVIIAGLAAGEPVVVAGAIVLRSELAKASLVDDD